MKMARNEDAVSPVIGVILMVAVTVILAAVIAAFVFGMSGNISKSHVVAATGQISADGSGVIVTYQGGQDAKTVTLIDIKSDGTASTGFVTATQLSNGTPGQPVPVGAMGKLAKGHIVATATFNDGSSSVILDSNYS